MANSTAGDDTVNFSFVAATTINLTGEIQITSNISIEGPGLNSYPLTDNLIISGNNTTRIFSIPGAVTVSIGGLILSNGRINDHGAAIYKTAVGSHLTLNYVKIINSTAIDNHGGGVANFQGSLTILNSTLSGNTAGRDGGGVYFEGDTLKIQNSTFNNNAANDDQDFGGGGVFTNDPTIISNSTFSGNTAALSGGAIYFTPSNGATSLVVRNSTIAGNTAQFAGGIFNDGGILNLYNSIVALNTAPSFANIYGSVTAGSNNITTGSPLLSALADNGGPTHTRSLPGGSTAINAGSNAQALDINGQALTNDQRGIGSARITNGAVDIGAFEFGSTPSAIFIVTRNDDRSTACNPGVDCSLREAVALADATAGEQIINFLPSLAGQTITLGSQINIGSNMTIQGLGATSLTVSGNNATRIFSITVPVTVTIERMTLTNGAVNDHGGAIYKTAVGSSLTLDTVKITNNTALGGNDGGGVENFQGSLTVLNSTFSGNTARHGGGIYFEGGTLKVQNSTFNNNASTNTQDLGGGAIYTDDTTLISNSTFSGNTAAYGGGGVYFLGGAQTITIRNSTFTLNTAKYGGGLFNSDGTMNLANSIVSKNNNSAGGNSPNIYNGNTLNNLGGNLLNHANPLLAPLADNGGPTQTIALLVGSPALNIGVNAQALDVNGQTLTTDQRGTGFPRFLGTVDSGAFEGVVAMISGSVLYGITPANQLQKFVPGVLLSATGTSSRNATTDSFGVYQLSGLTVGGNYTVTPSKSGIVNGVTAFDATLILRHVAAGGVGANALNANQQKAADTDGDNFVTAFDATLILRFVAANGANANTGQTGKWKFDPVSRPYNNLNSNPSGQDYTAYLIGDVDGDWTP